jgi:demethylmenaquinone methyltransferase/2-methoxy-6-polyprenyl-1,4-benzoquinol methylase
VVSEIFTTAHTRYDFLNHLLSLRRDVGWRECAVRRMRFSRTGRLLDVATGTADLAIAASRRHPGVSITGVDVAEPMLREARRKLRARGLDGRVILLKADARDLPFPPGSFDVTAVAFGMRNIPDKVSALREMARVTVRGGQVMVLEMSFAPARAFRGLYGLYLTRVLPLAGLLSPNPAAYAYLADSIRGFPAPDAFAALMRQAGLCEVRHSSLSFGTAYLHTGRVRGAGEGT